MYVVGGKNDTGHQSEVYAYDTVARTWTEVAPLPGAAVENPAIASVGGKLYAFGGSTAPFSGAVSNAASFDPATGAWTSLPPMPTARGGAGAAVVDGKIYVVGGMDASGTSLATVEIFDPATGSWSPGPSLTTRRDNPGVAALDGQVYVVGGRARNADGSSDVVQMNTMEILNPATGVWTAGPSMPTARRSLGVGTADGKLQVMGGEQSSDGSAFAANEEYDPVTNSWRPIVPLIQGRHGMAVATINDQVHAVGGAMVTGSAWSFTHTVFQYD
ncbi:Kelch repeat-containing protein [Demequina sediminis]|nr:kelch repeat-containing protein [Demequina sediminis]